MESYRDTFNRQQDFATSFSPSSVQLHTRNSPLSSSQLSPYSRRRLLLSTVMTPLERSAARSNYGVFSNPSNAEGNLLFPPTRSPTGNRLSLAMRPEQSSHASTRTATRPRLPRAASSDEVMKRKRFLVFMKVLLKCLKRSSDLSLHTQAKAIIADCTQRNRCRDPDFCPLPESVEQRLRPIVGEAQWNRAAACLDLYLEKRREDYVARIRDSHQQVFATRPFQRV